MERFLSNFYMPTHYAIALGFVGLCALCIMGAMYASENGKPTIEKVCSVFAVVFLIIAMIGSA